MVLNCFRCPLRSRFSSSNFQRFPLQHGRSLGRCFCAFISWPSVAPRGGTLDGRFVRNGDACYANRRLAVAEFSASRCYRPT